MTKIEWCDETINPIVGCTKVSPACDNCYAEIMARRLAGIKHTKEKYSQVITNGKWNGKIVFDKNELYKPFRWRKPRRIFITSMGDLFHEKVTWNQLDIILSVIACLPHHTFIMLTKRPEAMLKYFSKPKDELIARWENAIYELGIANKNDDIDSPSCFIFNRLQEEWPLKNLWLGATIENQEQLEKRLKYLIQIPAAIHFISFEPLLSNIDLAPVFGMHVLKMFIGENEGSYGIQWVIAGGETGHKARFANDSWFLSLRDQCKLAEIPFFFKGWGAFVPITQNKSDRLLEGKQYNEFPTSNIKLQTSNQ